MTRQWYYLKSRPCRNLCEIITFAPAKRYSVVNLISCIAQLFLTQVRKFYCFHPCLYIVYKFFYNHLIALCLYAISSGLIHELFHLYIVLRISVRISHICPMVQNDENNPRDRYKQEKKLQGKSSEKSEAWVFLKVSPDVFFPYGIYDRGCLFQSGSLDISKEFMQQYLQKQCNDGRVHGHGMTHLTFHVDIFTIHVGGRSIYQNVASLNILVHDVINLLVRKEFFVYKSLCFTTVIY